MNHKLNLYMIIRIIAILALISFLQSNSQEISIDIKFVEDDPFFGKTHFLFDCRRNK